LKKSRFSKENGVKGSGSEKQIRFKIPEEEKNLAGERRVSNLYIVVDLLSR